MTQTQHEPVSHTDDSVGIPILVFKIGTLRCAFVLDCVVQVFDAVEVGEFPESLPTDVVGLINIRGLVIPLIDIRRRWGLSTGKVQLSNQLIVIESEGTNLSIIVDEVLGTETVPLKRIVHLRDILPDENPHMAIADSEDIMILIDSERIYSAEEFRELRDWLGTQ